MSVRHAVRLGLVSLLVPLAACATAGASGGAAPPAASAPSAPAAAVWEPWPPAPAPRSSAQPAVISSPALTIDARAGGWRIDELFELVSAKTGLSLLYDSSNATLKQAKVEFVGALSLGPDDLFPWLQAVLAYRRLVLVPVGPKGPGGRQQWFVMDQADPSLKSRPAFVDEADVVDLADRDGLYIVTALRIRDMVDTTRVRNALSPLSTATAGIGRIQDIPGSRYIVVGDFAPVVAAMKSLLDRINANAMPPNPAVAPRAPGAPPEPR